MPVGNAAPSENSARLQTQEPIALPATKAKHAAHLLRHCNLPCKVSGYSASLQAEAEGSKHCSPPDIAALFCDTAKHQQQYPRQLMLRTKQLKVACRICVQSMQQTSRNLSSSLGTGHRLPHQSAFCPYCAAHVAYKSLQLQMGSEPGRAPGAEPDLQRCAHLPQSCGSAP